MKAFKTLLLLLVLTSTTAFAAPASDGTIKELLTVTRASKLLDGMRNHFDSLMSNEIQQALQGKKPSAQEQQAITNMKNRMVAVMQDELTWDKLEPLYLRLYKETFSEEELAGMLDFYKTPAGQAVIEKLPALMQKTMIEMQHVVGNAMPKMQKIQEEFVAEMKAANENAK
jgi:hypothetical protein